MNNQWIVVNGIVKQGHQVASGRAKDSPYPDSTIEMQTPFFQKLGLDLTPYFPGTLNISISPHIFTIKQPEYTFQNIEWTSKHPPEHFSFSRCKIAYQNIQYNALIYYPHPETKTTHFQDKSTIEILAPPIPKLQYESPIQLTLNPAEILITN